MRRVTPLAWNCTKTTMATALQLLESSWSTSFTVVTQWFESINVLERRELRSGFSPCTHSLRASSGEDTTVGNVTRLLRGTLRMSRLSDRIGNSSMQNRSRPAPCSSRPHRRRCKWRSHVK